MKLDTGLKNLILVVALGMLIPLTVKYGAMTLAKKPAPANQMQKMFYAKTAIGVACMVGAMKLTPAVLSTGVFLGGLVVFAKSMKCYWPHMTMMMHFVLLLLALGLVVFIILHKDGRFKPAKKATSRAKKK